MFSKIAANSREWSITFRLAWLYSASAVAMLMIATFVLYWIMSTSLDRENFQFLHYKASIWAKILENNTTHIANILKNEVLLEEGLYHNYTRITNETGRILFETPTMSEHVPAYAYANILTRDNTTFLTMRWRSAKDKKIYL